MISMNLNFRLGLSLGLSFLLGCSHAPVPRSSAEDSSYEVRYGSDEPKDYKGQTRGPADENFGKDPRRGNPYEYDPGAPKNSKWVELYGSTPNYRKVGNVIM